MDAERLAYLARLDDPYQPLGPDGRQQLRISPEPSEVAAMAREILRLLAYVRQLEAVADAARDVLDQIRDCGSVDVWHHLSDALGDLDAAKPPPPGDRGRGER
jgi:hypothetical protein